MTKKWSNLNLPGALHYVTGNVLHRIPIFTQEECCEIFLESWVGLLRDSPSKLIAFVIMPDHFHSIFNPSDGDIKGFIGALKSLSARNIVALTGDKRFLLANATHQLWQESFKAMPLWSPWMIGRRSITFMPILLGLGSWLQQKIIDGLVFERSTSIRVNRFQWTMNGGGRMIQKSWLKQ